MSINTKVARASLVLICISFLGHLLSLGKEMLVASRFGLMKEMDAFIAAVSVPNLLTNILISTFVAAFIPVIARYRTLDRPQMNRLVSTTVNYTLLPLVAVSAALFICADPIIRYGFHGLSPETARLASAILRIIAVTVVISGVTGIMSAVLNTFESFAWPAVLQMSVTICTIGFVVFMSGRVGIHALALGLLSGVAVQCVMLLILAGRKGFRMSFTLDRNDERVKEIFASAGLLLIGIVASQVNMLVDRVMASYLPEGSLAALGYADKLVQVPLIMLSASISTAIFPYLSRQAAENRIGELKDTLSKSIRMSGYIFIPLTAAAVILARPVIRLLFERGAFTPAATELTSIVFICYALQFFFYTASLLLARAFLALRHNRTLIAVLVLGIVLNIGLNRAFIALIDPPVAGIALSTSLVLLINTLLLVLTGRKKGLELDWRYILNGIVKMTGATAAAGAAMMITLHWISGMWRAATVTSDALMIGSTAAIGILVFMSASKLLAIEELTKAIATLRTLRAAPVVDETAIADVQERGINGQR